jgi:Neuraminidase (sialidase)
MLSTNMRRKWIIACAPAVLLTGAALREPFEYLVVPATETNMRNSEADMLRLKDGRLMLAWIDFYTTQGSDWGPARISAMFSKDSGRSWSGKYTLQENVGGMNVMEPDLLRLKSGKVLFLYCRKNSEADCRPYVRLSRDDAKTFSDPEALPIDPYPSYTGMNHDRAIQLKSGRIVEPLWYTPDYRIQRHIVTRAYYSDDEGRTWKQSRTLVDIPDSKAGAQEPGVVELKDGRIMMWIRTDKGKIYRSFSNDRGETWQHVRNLDEDASHTYAYTSIEFLDDRVLFTYYAGPPAGVKSEPRWSLKLKAVPISWLYE